MGVARKKLKLAKRELRRAMKTKKDNIIEKAEIFLERVEKQKRMAYKGKGASRVSKKAIQKSADSDVEDDDDGGKPPIGKKKKVSLLAQMSQIRHRNKDGSADDDDNEVDEDADEEKGGVAPETDAEKLQKIREKEAKAVTDEEVKVKKFKQTVNEFVDKIRTERNKMSESRKKLSKTKTQYIIWKEKMLDAKSEKNTKDEAKYRKEYERYGTMITSIKSKYSLYVVTVKKMRKQELKAMVIYKTQEMAMISLQTTIAKNNYYRFKKILEDAENSGELDEEILGRYRKSIRFSRKWARYISKKKELRKEVRFM